MWKEILVVLAISCTIATTSKVECRHDSQCGSDECCYYHEGQLNFPDSKKRQNIILPTIMFQGGWCEKYKTQGEYCKYISKDNGHCECGAGLKCTHIADPTLPPIIPTVVMTIPEHHRWMYLGGHTECQPIPST
ncbi:Hypothetical predicted protein [Mytilus galloprovincialis]|uniref:Prokineticin domain-containing protein n=1 Tax=Mytilus galloprovincialis TaxID=29158 RepID=A0A8B6FYE5_MYTGA|nr:Hypothetical predicted protein [Mytilus galloprovincialis]